MLMSLCPLIIHSHKTVWLHVVKRKSASPTSVTSTVTKPETATSRTLSSPCPALLLLPHHSDPVTLMNVDPDKGLVAARFLATRAMRASPWSIKRLATYALSYKFLQAQVVQPAFKFRAEGAVTQEDINRMVGDRYKDIPFLPRSLPDLTVDLTEHVRHYRHYAVRLVTCFTPSSTPVYNDTVFHKKWG